MKHIKLFEAFDQDIEYKSPDKMVKSMQTRKGTSTELLPQINNLTKNFDETKFKELLQKLRDTAVEKFGPGTDNPYEKYLQDILNKNSTMANSLKKLFKIAKDKIKDKKVLDTLRQMDGHLS